MSLEGVRSMGFGPVCTPADAFLSRAMAHKLENPHCQRVGLLTSVSSGAPGGRLVKRLASVFAHAQPVGQGECGYGLPLANDRLEDSDGASHHGSSPGNFSGPGRR